MSHTTCRHGRNGTDPPTVRSSSSPLLHPRVPWQHHESTEDDPEYQRSVSAPFPAAPSRRGCLRSLVADDNPRLTPQTSLPYGRGCPRTLAADDNPRLTPPASLPHDRGCPRFTTDDFPLRPPRRRSGCLCQPTDDFPLRPPWRRSGCLC